MKKINRLQRGMGIGGWLTNYKRFNVLPPERRLQITVGDMEHFESYITEDDVAYIASLGMDHIRLGFDQVVLEESPFVYRQSILSLLHRFTEWCQKYGVRPVLNLHKAIGNYCDIPDERGLMQNEELQSRFVALWSMLEDEFSGQEDVAVELLNEVINATAEEWNAVASKTIDAIRAKNAERVIVVGGVDWNNPSALPHVRLYDDENVIYTFHCYAPHEFTHQQGVLNANQIYYNRKMPYPCDDIERYREFYRLVKGIEKYGEYERMDKAFLRDYLQPAKQFIEEHPEAVSTFLSEYEASVAYAKANVEETAPLIVKYGIMDKEPLAKAALPKCNLTFIAGAEMKTVLSGYLQTLFDANPQSVGGEMPNDAFYYVAKAD